MRLYSSVRSSEGRFVILVLVYLGIGASKQKKKQIKSIDTQKFIHNVKLHILHGVLNSTKTNWELSDTKCSKSWAWIPRKSSKVLNSAFLVKWSLPKMQIAFLGLIYTCFSVFGTLRKIRKIAVKYPNSWASHS